MQLGRDLFQGWKEQSFGFEKTCYLETKGLIYPSVKSSYRKRKNKRKESIENEENREKRGCFPGKGISGGWEGIVAIKASIDTIKAGMGVIRISTIVIRAGIGVFKASAGAIRKNICDQESFIIKYFHK